MRNELCEEVREEFNLAIELKRQQEVISCALSASEKILQVLRGANPKEDSGCMKDDCIFDTLKINGSNLYTLERNLSEIARKIIG